MPSVVALVVIAVGFGGAGCKKKKAAPLGPATSSATTQGAALAASGSAPLPAAASAAPSPAPVDTVAAADRAALALTKDAVRDLKAMVKLGSPTNPDKPDEDANMKCASIDGARSRVEALADPEAKPLLAEAERLCALDVPLMNADQALKQATLSPSQASRALMCGLAAKDLDKARRVKADDRRVHDIDARLTRACK